MTLPRFKRTYKLSLSFNIVLYSAGELTLPTTTVKLNWIKRQKKVRNCIRYEYWVKGQSKGKGKGHTRTGHEGPEGE